MHTESVYHLYVITLNKPFEVGELLKHLQLLTILETYPTSDHDRLLSVRYVLCYTGR